MSPGPVEGPPVGTVGQHMTALSPWHREFPGLAAARQHKTRQDLALPTASLGWNAFRYHKNIKRFVNPLTRIPSDG